MEASEAGNYARLMAQYPYEDRPRWFRILIALDHLGNTIIGGKDLDETISSHGGRVLARRAEGDKRPGDWKWCLLCRFLDMFQKDHCIKSIGS